MNKIVLLIIGILVISLFSGCVEEKVTYEEKHIAEDTSLDPTEHEEEMTKNEYMTICMARKGIVYKDAPLYSSTPNSYYDAWMECFDCYWDYQDYWVNKKEIFNPLAMDIIEIDANGTIIAKYPFYHHRLKDTNSTYLDTSNSGWVIYIDGIKVYESNSTGDQS